MRVHSAAMLVAVAIAVAPFPVASRFAVAGDAKVADTLFRSGKQAYGKSDWAGAAVFFQKALDETPELIEACWWKASSQEKAGSLGVALASYREFLALYDAKARAGAPTKEEQRLRALADKSVETLSAGEREAKKLETAYVAALLAFARDNFVRDPGVSLRAVDRALAVQPANDEAQRLREKLSGGPAAASDESIPSAATGPFRDVKEWKDLIADHEFQVDEKLKDLFQYVGGMLVVDMTTGGRVKPHSFFDLGSSYAVEMECRVKSTYAAYWFVGFNFARKEKRCPAACITNARVFLGDESVDPPTILARFDTKSLADDRWHRLGVIVKRDLVDLWFDGKKVASWQEPSNAELAGELSLRQQSCRVDWRLFRIGKVD
jgi:hypothetical protein